MSSTWCDEADPAALSHAARLQLLERIAAERAALDALQVRTLAAIEAADASDKRWAREEVAAVLRLSPSTMSGRMKDAEHLVTLLPATLDALAGGRLSWGHARCLSEATYALDADAIRLVEQRCLDRVAAGYGRTVVQFRGIVTRAVARFDPRSSEQRHTDALAQRRVCFTLNNDGTTELWALLPADAAKRLEHALHRAARATSRLSDGTPDPRTADQRRADALVERATSGGGGQAGAGPSVQVVVSASTLLGLDDHPAELDGHGPVPAALARTIAADATGTWRRILTDPAGCPLEASKAYRPPVAVERFVKVRDRTCRFPGCRRRAVTCELDHVRPWPLGPTAADNLIPLCARHHHLKHEAAGWTIRRLRDGTIRWGTPAGRTIHVPPEIYEDVALAWPSSSVPVHDGWFDRVPDHVVDRWAAERVLDPELDDAA